MNALGPLFIFIAAVLWGVDGILRRSLYALPPSVIVFYEHLIGLIILVPVVFVLLRRGAFSFTVREWGALGVVALFSGLLGTLFFTEALMRSEYVPFSVVFLIQKLQPVFAVSTAALVLRETITKRYVALSVLAILAGFFVTFPGGVVRWGEGGAYLGAALLALMAAVCWGSSTALSRYALMGHSHTAVTAMRFALTVPLALIALLALGHGGALAAVTLPQLGTLALISLSTGMVALWLYYRGLRFTPVRVSAIVELAFPLTAIFIDYVLYDTVLEWTQYLAAFVLLFSMYLVARDAGTMTVVKTERAVPV